MSAPIRRRPGSTSPLALVPEVEELRTSPEASPAGTAAPAETASPITPTLTSALAPAVIPTAPVDPVAPASPVVPANVVVPASAPEVVESDEKKATTFGLRISLKKRAETAVLRTAGYEGGYASMTALVEGALARELERLANEFNGGVPFPQNSGGFRQGRPLGS